MGHEYSTKEVAELLGLSVAEVRRCVQAGFLTAKPGANGEVLLSFQDLVSLRRAAELVSARIRPHRVRRAFRRLREQLPESRPLSSVVLSAEGSSVVAREGESLWNPISGQMHLNFQLHRESEGFLEVATRPDFSGEKRRIAEALYEQACDLDEGGSAEAKTAYERALEAMPSHTEARINLGRLLHESGNVTEAEGHYRRVLEVAPHALASFNLGVALEDQGRTDQAVTAYQDAIAANPKCEDAYFNAARIYERQGDRAAALRALRQYRSLTRHLK